MTMKSAFLNILFTIMPMMNLKIKKYFYYIKRVLLFLPTHSSVQFEEDDAATAPRMNRKEQPQP